MKSLPVRGSRSQLTREIRLLRREIRRLKQKCRPARGFYYVAARPADGAAPGLRMAEGGRIFLDPEEAQERAGRMNAESEGEDLYHVFQGLGCDLRPVQQNEENEA